MARLIAIALVACSFAAPAHAQPKAPDLLALVPDDFALCLAVRDLRGQYDALMKSSWYAAFRESAPGQAFFASPEFARLKQAGRLPKTAFNLDWDTLRDEILGDDIVLAFRPSAAGGADEEGLVLLRARNSALLARLIEQLNEVQRQNGELRALEGVEYKGRTYQKRNDRGKILYDFLDGPLLVVAGKDATMQSIIDAAQRPSDAAPWRRRFQRADAIPAFVTLGVNPRLLDVKRGEAPPLWEALESIFVTLRPGDPLELRLSVQASPEHLPAWLRSALLEAPSPSLLWQRFPSDAVLEIAGRTNFADALAAVNEMTPPPARKHLAEAAQRSIGAMTGLDFFKDILPNVGPDWGLCVLPGSDAGQVPQLLIALAVQPGAGKEPVDRALHRVLQVFAGLAVLNYNHNHPDALRHQSTLQDNVEVRFLHAPKLFPPGFQPAYAVKEGYLLLASTPDAMQQFRKSNAAAPEGDTPLLRLSTRGLADMLRHRQELIIAKLTQRQQMSSAEAQQQLARFTQGLDLFNRVELSRRAEVPGRADWTLRVYPK